MIHVKCNLFIYFSSSCNAVQRCSPPSMQQVIKSHSYSRCVLNVGRNDALISQTARELTLDSLCSHILNHCRSAIFRKSSNHCRSAIFRKSSLSILSINDDDDKIEWVDQKEAIQSLSYHHKLAIRSLLLKQTLEVHLQTCCAFGGDLLFHLTLLNYRLRGRPVLVLRMLDMHILLLACLLLGTRNSSMAKSIYSSLNIWVEYQSMDGHQSLLGQD